jgi:SAM-dependent methyltransferase
MNPYTDYISINRASWNNRVETHLKSDFYGMEEFMKGKSSLNDIELNLLGDIKDKSILHLQCHFGQDSISLSRMGARVTGVDLSDKAIEQARKIAEDCMTNTQFICCNLYDLADHLNEEFDIVFSSYGTIGWLPDLDQWAAIVSRYLKPGGRFVFAEFHPVVWMFDDDFAGIAYHYHNNGPIFETDSGTYADRNAAISQDNVIWNHSLANVFNGLIRNGLEMNSFHEFDYSPYNCFKNTVESEPGKFRIQHLGDKIPMVYALDATKKSR